MGEPVEVFFGAADWEGVDAGLCFGEPFRVAIEDGAFAGLAWVVAGVAGDEAVLNLWDAGEAERGCVFETFGHDVTATEFRINREAGFAFKNFAGPERVTTRPDVDKDGVEIGLGQAFDGLLEGRWVGEGITCYPDAAKLACEACRAKAEDENN